MSAVKIRNHLNNTVIFEGDYNSFKECLEDAVHKNIDLSYADLSLKNLTAANIDSAQLLGAKFDFSNLCNINLSEANLRQISFKGTSLLGACFADSDLSESDFTDASFGACLMDNAIMDKCMFNTLSAFELPWMNVKSHHNAIFKTIYGIEIDMSTSRVTIKGLLPAQLTIIANTLLLGHKRFDLRLAQHLKKLAYLQFKDWAEPAKFDTTT